jgi:cytokinin dehydrogenase
VRPRSLRDPRHDEARHDFGRLHEGAPQLVAEPRCADDVAEIVRFARDHGRRVVARGHGCSSNGQSLSRDLLLDGSRLDSLRVIDEDRVEVGGGCTWGALHRFLTAQGRESPVVVSNPAATFGGTLSVGGIGPSSLHEGALVEHVTAATIVTGGGEIVEASPAAADPSLFRHVMCGQGQLGVIVAAELRTRARGSLALERHTFGATTDVAALVALAAGARTCRLVHHNASRTWKLEIGRAAEDAAGSTPSSDYVEQLFEKELRFVPSIEASLVAAGLLADAGEARRMWADFLVPVEHAGALLHHARGLFDDPVLTPAFNCSVLLRRGPPELPLLPVPAAEAVFSVGPYSIVPPGRVAAYRDKLDALADHTFQLGGRQYLHGYHRRTRAFYERQFGGPAVDAWIRAKARFDPAGVMGVPPWP